MQPYFPLISHSRLLSRLKAAEAGISAVGEAYVLMMVFLCVWVGEINFPYSPQRNIFYCGYLLILSFS